MQQQRFHYRSVLWRQDSQLLWFNRIANSSGSTTGYIRGNDIRDSRSSFVGSIRGNYVYNSYNSRIGEIRDDGSIYDSRNSFFGKAKGVKKEWVAVFYFFPQLLR